MGVTITVDLANSTPSDIARAAKFMLEFAGYQAPSVAQNASNAAGAARDSWVGSQQFPEATGGVVGAIVGGGPRGSLGEEVHPEPAEAFAPGTPEAALAAAVAAPPVPAVAPAPAATLPPPPPGIEVDAQGVPWDARIHAGSRAKIGDGTWRQKRNLDPEVYKQVMDELRHTMGVERRAPQPPAPPAPQQVFAPHPPVPPVPAAVPMPPADSDDNGPVDATPAAPVVPPAPFVASATPPAPPISSTPPVPVSAGAATGASPGSVAGKAPTFPELVKRITAAFNAKTMTQADVSRAVQKVGLTALPMLAARPDLVGDVATELGIAL